MLFEILKKAQTLLQLIFEHINLIIQLIPILTIIITIIINSLIKARNKKININNKSENKEPNRNWFIFKVNTYNTKNRSNKTRVKINFYQ